MRLYLMDDDKLFKFLLPEKVDGSFLFTYKNKKNKLDNILNVEEIDGKWKLIKNIFNN